MTNQGYRITEIASMIICIWGILKRFGFIWQTDYLIVAATILFWAGWYVQSSMFRKLSPDLQIQIGYAVPEDFDRSPNGELIEKREALICE